MNKEIILTVTVLTGLLVPSCKPQVTARFVPERSDDFVFENNLICGRIYGEAIEKETVSPGIDIWVKKPGKLAADQISKGEPENLTDCYKEGVSLGGGASAPVIKGKLQFPATNFRSWEILESGPRKVVFALDYPEWQTEGPAVSLRKIITVVPGTYFCKVDDIYSFPGDGKMQVAAGVFRHPSQGTVEEEMIERDRYAIWERASDRSTEPEDGRIGVAVIMPGAEFCGIARGDEHGICRMSVHSGDTLTYYFGNCWSKGRVRRPEKWFNIVKKKI